MRPSAPLSERQIAIVRLLVAGHTNSEIAEELHLSVNTIKWYLQQIYQEMGVRNRVEAVARAREEGYLPGEPAVPAVGHLLPAPTTTFFGRNQELKTLVDLLLQPDRRLVSICGLGGAGKTRLALETGRRLTRAFPDGICFIPLAAAGFAGEVWERARRQMQLPRSGSTSDRRLVLGAVRGRRLLLIFDNVEHLADFPAELHWLLSRTRRPKVLVTSRTRLNLQAEQFFPINGIGHLGGVDSPAYQLFLETARRQNPFYEPSDQELIEIIDLCELVEGMPLALELAAAWSDVLSPGAIAAQLRRDLSGLAQTTDDRPARQHSLAAVFNYSWQRMAPSEQAAAMALSPLVHPFTRETALAVSGAGPADVQKLVRLSFLQPAGGGRLVIHELVRLFFVEQVRLAGLDFEMIQDRVMAHYLTRLARDSRQLRLTLGAACLQRLTADFQPILDSWQRAVARGRWELLENGIDFAMVFEARGFWADGEALFAATRQAVPPDRKRLRARLDEARALFAFRTYDLPGAKRLADRALAVLAAEEIGEDGAGLYAYLAQAVHAYAAGGFGAYTKLIQAIEPLTRDRFGPDSLLLPQMFAATHACAQGRHAAAAGLFTGIIERSHPDAYSLPALYCMLGLALQGMADWPQARAVYEKGLARAREIPVFPAQVAATIELARLDNPAANRDDLRRALEPLHGVIGGRAQLGRLLIHLGGQYLSFGLFPQARQLFRLGIQLLQGRVSRSEMGRTLVIVGKFLIYQLAIAGRRD